MKKSIKKLSLNKMTISNLSSAQMNALNGGVKKTQGDTCKCASADYSKKECNTTNCILWSLYLCPPATSYDLK